jgi:hypothetical protein
MNIEGTTYKYYSQWANIDITSLKSGVYFVYNQDRDSVPKGYSSPMDVYIFRTNDKLILSYRTRAKEKAETLSKKINELIGINSLKTILEKTFSKNVNHNIKYVYRTKVENQMKVEILTPDEHELFVDFFRANHPDVKDYSWVKDYFLELASKNYCHGIIVDNKLVSVTDAPDMPFLQDCVQEIGINTLKDYRGKGYARAACISFINELLSKDICPIWSTSNDNTASDRLAYSIGFEKLSDVLTISM